MNPRDRPERCQRPWGWFETLHREEGALVKRLQLLPGRRISLQRHRHRSEHWVVIAGAGRVHWRDRSDPLETGGHVFIGPGTWHRAEAGGQGLVIIEVQRGVLLSEEDVERLEDDYGRAAGQGSGAGIRGGTGRVP
jgi:mannose-6-phosphate isomerase-like protein (cupin superfamily)